MTVAFEQFGRAHLLDAWLALFGRAPELHEIQLVQAVAKGEGGYGQASYRNALTGESAVLNNWGATQCPHGPPCGADCFEVTDHHADGSPYQWCYHRFATPEEGAASYLRILKKIVDRSELGFAGALSTRSVDSFVRSMKQGGYFELRLDLYQANVWKHVQEIARALGEPLAVQKEEGSAIGESPFSTSSSGSPQATLPTASQNASEERDACWKREAVRIFNSNGNPEDDVETYPEDD